jgi:hypothetical protein
VSLRNLTLQAAVLKVLGDEIAARIAIVKALAQDAFEAAESTQAPAVLPDGTKVATVSLAGAGGCTASVDDAGAFTAWVLRAHPGETETVVRDGYRRKVLDAAKKAGRAVDPVTGEFIPGIGITESKSYVSVRFSAGGADAVADAWQAGELAAIDVVRPRAVTGGTR